MNEFRQKDFLAWTPRISIRTPRISIRPPRTRLSSCLMPCYRGSDPKKTRTTFPNARGKHFGRTPCGRAVFFFVFRENDQYSPYQHRRPAPETNRKEPAEHLPRRTAHDDNEPARQHRSRNRRKGRASGSTPLPSISPGCASPHLVQPCATMPSPRGGLRPTGHTQHSSGFAMLCDLRGAFGQPIPEVGALGAALCCVVVAGPGSK